MGGVCSRCVRGRPRLTSWAVRAMSPEGSCLVGFRLGLGLGLRVRVRVRVRVRARARVRVWVACELRVLRLGQLQL